MASPYADLPRRSFWRPSVAELNPFEWRDLYIKRFPIAPDAKIATAGSCFAQHIGRQLRLRGFNYLDAEPPPPSLPAHRHADFGYGLFSARYGNIYTARQLLQLHREAFYRFRPEERTWAKDGRVYDPFRPNVEPDGFVSADELRALRKHVHLPAVREVFLNCDVFIFTLGLTEAWISKRDGAVFPTCPGTIAGEFDPALHEFHNFGFAEIHSDMVAFIEAARAANPDMKLLLTVSPVPLTATASDQHVLSATTYSKSVLRAVAGALYQDYDFVDYFPSYEIVTAPAMRGELYQPDMRNVTARGVDHVMSHFFAQHPPPVAEAPGKGARPDPVAARQERMAREVQADAAEFRAVCEDEKLDAVHG